MNKQFFILLLLIVFVVGGIVLFAQQKKSPTVLTKVSFVLDFLPWSGQAGVWVAKEKGYFTNEGLDVTLNIPSDPSTVLQTVAAGRDDFGISYLPEILTARAKNIPVVSIMALVQHPLNSIISLKEFNINEPKDLVGKKIGHGGVPLNEIIIDTMLKSQGKSIKDVEVVNVGFDHVPALIGKKVDAILAYEIYEGISATNQGFSVNLLLAEKYGVPDYYEFALVTNEKTISEKKDLVQRFVRAVKKGYEDAIADPESAIMLMKKAKPEADLSIGIPSVKLLAPLWLPENKVFGWQEESRWTNFANWMKDNGLLKKDVDATKSFDNTFVENAR